jgi:hypothetical protein
MCYVIEPNHNERMKSIQCFEKVWRKQKCSFLITFFLSFFLSLEGVGGFFDIDDTIKKVSLYATSRYGITGHMSLSKTRKTC